MAFDLASRYAGEEVRQRAPRGSSQTGPWTGASEHALDRNTLLRLLGNAIPYIRVPAFATPEECEAVTRHASDNGFSPYRGVEPKINRIGCTVFEYDSISKDDYFRAADRQRLVQKRIFGASFDPIARLIEMVAEKTGLSIKVAEESHGRPYFAGLLRRIESGTLLHVDYAAAEQSGWKICQVVDQLSWNVYLRISNVDEGHTHIYERQWSPDDMGQREGGYGFKPSVIQGARLATFEPRVGDLILFNTKNYHRVDSTGGERVTVTSALGRMPDGELLLWS